MQNCLFAMLWIHPIDITFQPEGGISISVSCSIHIRTPGLMALPMCYSSRLSNGPIESLNRKIKDLKRLGRGFRSFEHFRNRFLYAARNNPVLYAVSESRQVQYFDEEDIL